MWSSEAFTYASAKRATSVDGFIELLTTVSRYLMTNRAIATIWYWNDAPYQSSSSQPVKKKSDAAFSFVKQ